MPPAAFTDCTPSVASESPPVRTTAITRFLNVWAAEVKSGLAEERTCLILRPSESAKVWIRIDQEVLIWRSNIHRPGVHLLAAYGDLYFEAGLPPQHSGQQIGRLRSA